MDRSSDWGRVDDDGTVFVRTGTGERAVGSWQAGDPAAGLAHYTRRYDDLATEVDLLDKRLASGAAEPGPTLTHARQLAEALPSAAAVGDLDALSTRLAAVASAAEAKLAEVRARKAEAKAAATARKEALAVEAETFAESTQWKSSGDRLRDIVEEWKQIKGVDRRTDEVLWKRFTAARDAFGKRRGAHFAELGKERDRAGLRKAEIVEEAEGLASSTDWGPTAARMRELLADWKASGRAARGREDVLWSRFRAAQDTFFAARSAVFSERDAEQVANQKRKEALIDEAGELDPAADLDAAKAALREIQERYDAVGHVPREAIRGLDSRMKAAEERIRDAVEDEWETDNPLLLQMRAAVTKAESTLTKAHAAGDAARIAEAEAALTARREWLAEAEKSAR